MLRIRAENPTNHHRKDHDEGATLVSSGGEQEATRRPYPVEPRANRKRLVLGLLLNLTLMVRGLPVNIIQVQHG